MGSAGYDGYLPGKLVGFISQCWHLQQIGRLTLIELELVSAMHMSAWLQGLSPSSSLASK